MPMHILFVAPTDPRKTSYGGQQRTHVIWKGLCSIPGTKVHVIVPVPHRAQEKDDTEDGVAHICLEKRYSIGWFLQRFLKKFIPYWDCSLAYDWRKLHKHFANVDLVVSRYIQPAAAFKLWKLAPLYIDADDIHSYEYKAKSEILGQNLRRRFIQVFLEWYQNSIYRKARHIWLPASEQLCLLDGFPVSCLPNIPCDEKLPDFSSVIGSKNKLLFVGYMRTDPNIVAIDWFLSNYWDDVKKQFPQMELDIIGDGLPDEYKIRWEHFSGVHLLGFVNDIYEFISKALATITPMRIGMGSCIKVLESLAIGRCVISTEHGLRGISEEQRIQANGIFKFGDLKDLCRVIQSLQNSDFRLVAQRGARDFVHASYNQSNINDIIKRDVARKDEFNV